MDGSFTVTSVGTILDRYAQVTAVTLQTISASTNNYFIIVLVMTMVGVATAVFLIRRRQA